MRWGASLPIAIAALSFVGACKRRAIEEERARAQKAKAEAEAHAQAAADAKAQAEADAKEDAASSVDFSSLPATLVAIAADPEKSAHEPRGSLDNGLVWASIDLPGCFFPSVSWDPKKKDVWGFRDRCPGLKPEDLAPPGGIDTLDESYMIVTTGPLAGVFLDRNLIDPDIWTIATVGWRMKGDASMFVFCARGRVPGRTYMDRDTFRDRCRTMMEKRVGIPSSKFDPPEPTSGADCGYTWKVEATFEKELFDENKITRRFTCVYDAAKPEVRLDVGK